MPGTYIVLRSSLSSAVLCSCRSVVPVYTVPVQLLLGTVPHAHVVSLQVVASVLERSLAAN
jgi:hypothetical protein